MKGPPNVWIWRPREYSHSKHLDYADPPLDMPFCDSLSTTILHRRQNPPLPSLARSFPRHRTSGIYNMQLGLELVNSAITKRESDSPKPGHPSFEGKSIPNIRQSSSLCCINESSTSLFLEIADAARNFGTK
jgi:hypothetical protein